MTIGHSHDGVFKVLGRHRMKFCLRCNVPFNDGDEIHVQVRRAGRRLYHKKCWEALFI